MSLAYVYFVKTILFFTKTISLSHDCHMCYVTAKPKKRSRKKLLPREPDHTHLACGHHRAIVASFSLVSFLRRRERGRVLVVGLGGGALPAYIHKHFPMVRILMCSSCCFPRIFNIIFLITLSHSSGKSGLMTYTCIEAR